MPNRRFAPCSLAFGRVQLRYDTNSWEHLTGTSHHLPFGRAMKAIAPRASQWKCIGDYILIFGGIMIGYWSLLSCEVVRFFSALPPCPDTGVSYACHLQYHFYLNLIALSKQLCNLPVDIFSMPNSQNQDPLFFILYGAYQPVITYAVAPEVSQISL